MKLQAAKSLLITQDLQSTQIGQIGLGYVGLPLALEFGRQYSTVWFDVDASRVDELQQEFYHINVTRLGKRGVSVVYDPKAVFDRSIATLRI